MTAPKAVSTQIAIRRRPGGGFAVRVISAPSGGGNAMGMASTPAGTRGRSPDVVVAQPLCIQGKGTCDCKEKKTVWRLVFGHVGSFETVSLHKINI